MYKCDRAPGYQALLHYKNDLIRVINQHIPQGTIYLFSSHAMGLSSEASDVDLAIDTGEEIDRKILDKLCVEVDALQLPFFVDVVDLSTVYESLREQIKEHGIVWRV